MIKDSKVCVRARERESALVVSEMPTSESQIPLPKYLQEDDLTQECGELLQYLPKENGWVTNNLHQYQGFWHTRRQLEGVLTCQRHFQANDSDIILITTPKSGTTWLKAILFTLLNRMKNPPTSENHPLLANNPHELVPFLELKLFFDKQVPDLSFLPSPRLFASHLPIGSLPESVKGSRCRLVYLCRDPKDTFVSLWHFTNKLRSPRCKGENSLEAAFEKFCRGVSLCGPFWDHVLEYWKESLERPRKVFFLRYEEMKEQPDGMLRRLADFLGCPFSPEEEARGLPDGIMKLCSFECLSNLEVNKRGRLSSGEEFKFFFRRGVVGDWMNYLSTEMIERLERITEEKFLGSELQL